jgi:hypothetical protein
MQGSKSMPVKAKKRTRVANQVKLDARNPIPFENNHLTFSFINNVSYLPFLPPDDNFGATLLEARLLSTTQNACVTTKKDYCAGEGFMDKNGTEFNEQILAWFASMNLRNEPLNEINKKIFEDLFTYGNVPIEIVRFSVAGKKKLMIYVHSFLEWRLAKPDDNDVVQFAIQSKLFLKKKQFLTADMLKNSKKLPIYNPNNPDKQNWIRDDKGVERTLIWLKNSISGFSHYGLPSSVATLIYQVLEYKGARYNLDNIENNMVIGGVLALKGNIGQDEANRIGKQIISTHTGDGRRGRVAVVASEEGIDGSDFHDYDTTKDASYTTADDKWTQKIILGNEWDAILAGIVSPSTLGKGSGFITKIMEIKFKSVIRPAQTTLLDKVWKTVFKIADEWLSLGFDKFEIVFKNSIDISGLTDVDITPAVQINEVRTAKGLTEDPAMKGVYMQAPKQAANPDPSKEGGDNVPA